ncbi:hypothetical protein PENTCL1PPCAC_16691, partial [Pristionchus entomophagus]
LIPLLQLILNVFSTCAALLLLRIIQATQLHPNCKYLLTFWCTGYLSLFLAHGGISYLNVTSVLPPTRKIGPPLRSFLIDISVSSQFTCALLEIAIASERLMSAVRPLRYYNSGKSCSILYPATGLVLSISAIFGYLTEVSSNHFLDAALILIIDISTLTVNSISVKYCKKRFEMLHGKASLNARYQVREAQEVASSMMRSYIVCFVFKNFFNGFVLLGCAYTDEQHYCNGLIESFPMAYHNMEAEYTGGLSGTSCFLLCWLMWNHPRLRRKLDLIISTVMFVYIQVFICIVFHFQGLANLMPISNKSTTEVICLTLKNTESDVYFEALRKTWT